MGSGLLLKRSFIRSEAVGEGSVAVGEFLKVNSELRYTWQCDIKKIYIQSMGHKAHTLCTLSSKVLFLFSEC